MTVLAVTGATGFVGGHLVRIALANGHRVRALTRKAQADISGVTWVPGSLGDSTSLEELARGAEVVIHVAGVVNAPDRAGFAEGNVAGTREMIDAATRTGVSRFVHVSSLAAREPGLSHYGWSKAEAERHVRTSALAWTIVRPPAIYGPNDREMLELFRMASRGIVLLPPRGRLSLIEVSDLARLLLAVSHDGAAAGQTYEPDDGTANGWDHRDFARMLGAAVGRSVAPLSVPAAMLRIASKLEAIARGGAAKLTADRVRYFCHPDWVVSAARRPDAAVWAPQVATGAGLAETARWYREQGWLRQ